MQLRTGQTDSSPMSESARQLAAWLANPAHRGQAVRCQGPGRVQPGTLTHQDLITSRDGSQRRQRLLHRLHPAGEQQAGQQRLHRAAYTAWMHYPHPGSTAWLVLPASTGWLLRMLLLTSCQGCSPAPTSCRCATQTPSAAWLGCGCHWVLVRAATSTGGSAGAAPRAELAARRASRWELSSDRRGLPQMPDSQHEGHSKAKLSAVHARHSKQQRQRGHSEQRPSRFNSFLEAAKTCQEVKRAARGGGPASLQARPHRLVILRHDQAEC